jgi:hypothetical protein
MKTVARIDESTGRVVDQSQTRKRTLNVSVSNLVGRNLSLAVTLVTAEQVCLCPVRRAHSVWP